MSHLISRWVLVSSRGRHFLPAAAVAFVCLSVLAPCAWAQEPAAEPPAPSPAPKAGGAYEALPAIPWMRDDFRDPDRNEDKRRRDQRGEIKKTIANIMRDERGDVIKDGNNARTFDVFFTQHIFAQMTQPERATEFAADRKVFFHTYMLPIKSAAVHERLVKDLAMPMMLDIAKRNFHPAARYNAMLIIGDLNQTEAVKGGASPAAPEPYRPALTAMLKEFNAPEQIDVVRVACLVGILRHAEMDGQKQNLETRWPPAGKLLVIEPMLALLNAKDPPSGRTVEGHVWMQRRALDILGAIGDPGTDSAVAKKMEAIIADEKAPMSLRCTAAVSLGRIGSLAQAKFDPTEAVRKLGALALEAGHAELARLEAEKKRRDELLKPYEDEGGYGAGGTRQPGMPGGMRPGGAGGARMPPGMAPPGMSPRQPGGSGGVRPPGMSPPGMSPPGASPRPSAGGSRSQLKGSGSGPSMPGGPGSGYPRMGSGYPGMGGASGSESFAEELAFREKYKLNISCRRLKYELSCVKTGLEGTSTRPGAGLKVQSKDPLTSHIDKLTGKIDELGKIVDKTDPELDVLIKDLRKGVGELDAVVKAAPSGAKPAEAAGDPPADGPDADGPPARGPAKAPAKADPSADGPAPPAGGPAAPVAPAKP